MTRFSSLTKLFHVENRLVTNPLDIMKNELFLQDPDYNEINGIMETEKVRFHEWLNGVMFSEKEVKTYQAFPVKVAPVIEDDIKLKIEVLLRCRLVRLSCAGFIIICRLVFRIE